MMVMIITITFFFPLLGVGLDCLLYSYDMYDTSLPLLLSLLMSTLLFVVVSLLDFLFFCALLALCSLLSQRGAGMCSRGGEGFRACSVRSKPHPPPLLFPLPSYLISDFWRLQTII